MIFDKDANFPYPVLSYKSDSYEYNDFMLSINLDENTMNYKEGDKILIMGSLEINETYEEPPA